MAIFLKGDIFEIFQKKSFVEIALGFLFWSVSWRNFAQKKTLVRTLLLYQLFALCSFFSLRYLLENIVHNFISHKVMAHAPCWW
jgi:hypothetical protein